MKKLFIFIIVVLLFTCGMFANNSTIQTEPEVIQEFNVPVITFRDKDKITNIDLDNLKDFYMIEDMDESITAQLNHTIEEDKINVCVEFYEEDELKAVTCKEYPYEEYYWFTNKSITLVDRINQYLFDHEIDPAHISYFYYNTVTQEDISYEEQKIFQAASTVKVPLVMAYQDLIDEGKVNPEDELLFDEKYYEPSYNDLIDDYPIGSLVPISVCMDRAIQYSDNSANHILFNHYFSYSGEYFRNHLAKEYSQQTLDRSFYLENQISAQMLKNVLIKLYEHSDKYARIIDNMFIAYPNLYIKLNGYTYDVYHKYGSYDIYLHDMAIIDTPEPILVGIFTENEENAKLISDISSIMVEYCLIHQK